MVEVNRLMDESENILEDPDRRSWKYNKGRRKSYIRKNSRRRKL